MVQSRLEKSTRHEVMKAAERVLLTTLGPCCWPAALAGPDGRPLPLSSSSGDGDTIRVERRRAKPDHRCAWPFALTPRSWHRLPMANQAPQLSAEPVEDRQQGRTFLLSRASLWAATVPNDRGGSTLKPGDVEDGMAFAYLKYLCQCDGGQGLSRCESQGHRRLWPSSWQSPGRNHQARDFSTQQRSSRICCDSRSVLLAAAIAAGK